MSTSEIETDGSEPSTEGYSVNFTRFEVTGSNVKVAVNITNTYSFTRIAQLSFVGGSTKGEPFFDEQTEATFGGGETKTFTFDEVHGFSGGTDLKFCADVIGSEDAGSDTGFGL